MTPLPGTAEQKREEEAAQAAALEAARVTTETRGTAEEKRLRAVAAAKAKHSEEKPGNWRLGCGTHDGSVHKRAQERRERRGY